MAAELPRGSFGDDVDGEDWDEDENSSLAQDGTLVSPEFSPMPKQATIEDLKRVAGERINANKILNEPEILHPVSEYNDIRSQNGTTRDINFAFLHNQARYFCVYSLAPLGIGKTSYSLKTLMQLYGEYDYDGHLIKLCEDWEKLKAHIVFHPQSFKQIIQHLQRTKTRIKALVWDDAGIFLASKDWQKAWAKEIVKYFQLARTYCASIILTTPSPSLILKDIRRLNMVTINVEYAASQFSDQRRAKSYDHWYLPDLTKPRLSFRGTDRFSVRLPDSIFNPYQEMRATYADFELTKVFDVIGNDGLEMVGQLNLDKLAVTR
jgi:hypothetical protein